MEVRILKLYSDSTVPLYQTTGSAGADLHAHLQEPITLLPSHKAIISTGISIEIPHGFEAQIRPRSGLAAKNSITVLNSPGTIDSDYRGEIKVILINLGVEAFIIEHNMRIAQIIFAPVVQANFKETSSIQDTIRSTAGFGSTGV